MAETCLGDCWLEPRQGRCRAKSAEGERRRKEVYKVGSRKEHPSGRRELTAPGEARSLDPGSVHCNRKGPRAILPQSHCLPYPNRLGIGAWLRASRVSRGAGSVRSVRPRILQRLGCFLQKNSAVSPTVKVSMGRDPSQWGPLFLLAGAKERKGVFIFSRQGQDSPGGL